MPLTITRKMNSGVWIICKCNPDGIHVYPSEIRRNQVRISISCPKHIQIFRDEIMRKIDEDQDEYEPAVADISDCDRCGGFHEEVTMLEFKRPTKTDTHYYFCPDTNEPVILNLE